MGGILQLAGVLAQAACASKLEVLSFKAPFQEVDSGGERVLGNMWRTSGSAVVHTNFVRLTPDRQSKKGAVWSASSLGVVELSATIKFRISGQGKKYFGDGMALWLTDVRSYRAGDFHGVAEEFRGVGVIFDTFKNVETVSLHKDITVVINEGSSDAEAMLSGAIGCAGRLRYHEDRGDFSVAALSRAKLTIAPLSSVNDTALGLTVLLDEENSGIWVECAKAKLPQALDAAWLHRAHLGITASTGQLADNHDLLSLEVFDDQFTHLEAEVAQAQPRYFQPGEGITTDRFARIESQLDALVAQLEHLQHQLEHEMVAVDDHVRVTLEKLSRQEDISMGRIDALEAKVVSNVEDSLSQRIAALEQAMRDAVQKRISTVESRYMSKLGEVVSQKVERAGRGWTLPFVFLIIIDIVAFFGCQEVVPEI
jgi:mannose-binding lectin 2